MYHPELALSGSRVKKIFDVIGNDLSEAGWLWESEIDRARTINCHWPTIDDVLDSRIWRFDDSPKLGWQSRDCTFGKELLRLSRCDLSSGETDGSVGAKAIGRQVMQCDQGINDCSVSGHWVGLVEVYG